MLAICAQVDQLKIRADEFWVLVCNMSKPVTDSSTEHSQEKPCEGS